MAGTSRRLLLGAVATAVVGLVAIGPCRTGDDDADPLPSPALDGLHLEAELGRDLSLTVRLDADADRSIELPGTPTALVAHRGVRSGGGVVLAVGRGRLVDVEPEIGVRADHPVVVAPGSRIDLRAWVVPDWLGPGGPESASREELAEASVVRVCLWGALHAPTALPTEATDPAETRRLGCVDVDVG